MNFDEPLTGIKLHGPSPSESPDSYREGVRPIPSWLSSTYSESSVKFYRKEYRNKIPRL
ncbi:MAG: hypothetical protein ABI237_06350 [Ginsengibacter sp.]